MNDLSLKGVARKYGGLSDGFSVTNDIFGVPSIGGSESLRSKLESMAREEHSFAQSECIFNWTAAFEQTWTHMRVRIRLNPDADVSAQTMATLRRRWRTGIENIWTHRWGCGLADELTCRLSFEVLWVNANPHHDVRVNTGMKCVDDAGNPIVCRTNKGRWHTGDSGNVAAHEFGHMLGLVDEYTENPPCPNRNPVNTGTIMDHNSNNVPARMMTRFANNIGSNVVAI